MSELEALKNEIEEALRYVVELTLDVKRCPASHRPLFRELLRNAKKDLKQLQRMEERLMKRLDDEI